MWKSWSSVARALSKQMRKKYGITINLLLPYRCVTWLQWKLTSDSSRTPLWRCRTKYLLFRFTMSSARTSWLRKAMKSKGVEAWRGIHDWPHFSNFVIPVINSLRHSAMIKYLFTIGYFLFPILFTYFVSRWDQKTRSWIPLKWPYIEDPARAKLFVRVYTASARMTELFATRYFCSFLFKNLPSYFPVVSCSAVKVRAALRIYELWKAKNVQPLQKLLAALALWRVARCTSVGCKTLLQRHQTWRDSNNILPQCCTIANHQILNTYSTCS